MAVGTYLRSMAALGLLVSSVGTFGGAARAQAMLGRQMPDRPVVSIDYYKTPPGKQDEWLALYLKWHRPIMDWQIRQGLTISSTVYANASHAMEPSWDFVIINVAPSPKDGKAAPMTRGQVIKSLFPDLDAYYAGEKSRWALTVGHWDQRVMEVDLRAKHPGLYYPILPDGQ